MAVVLKAIAREYAYIYYDLRGGYFYFVWWFVLFVFAVCFSDKRTDSFFLVSTPWPVLGIVGLYCYFIFKFGPNFMKDRPPYNLKKVLVVYNVGQILLNGYIVLQVWYNMWMQLQVLTQFNF